MKQIGILVVIIITLLSCRNKFSVDKQDTFAKDFQYKMNVEFADKETSPLTDKDFKTFSKLHFFPINSKYRIKAKFIKAANEKPFNMLTTTSRVASYVKYGEAYFKIDGKEHKLAIYQNLNLIKQAEYSNHLFLPFTDLTNNKTSYAGGRYLDLKKTDDEVIVLDFNQAYNPYCAYNNKYSCPIPPAENHLDVAIKAGVLKFH